MKSVFRVLIMVLTFFYTGISFGVGIADFVNIKKLCPSIQVDLIYAQDPKFAHKKVYSDCPSDVCFFRVETAKKLVAVQEELALQGLGLKIVDGYRPLSVRDVFWEDVPDGYSEKGQESTHNRGASVDLTLINLSTGQELEMSLEIGGISKKERKDYPMKIYNCMLLENIMRKHGFASCRKEWWHFNDEDWNQYEFCNISFAELMAAESLKDPELVQR